MNDLPLPDCSSSSLPRYAGEDGDPGLLEEMHDQLRVTIQKTFNVTPELAARLHEELIQCVKRKHLVSSEYAFQKGLPSLWGRPTCTFGINYIMTLIFSHSFYIPCTNIWSR